MSDFFKVVGGILAAIIFVLALMWVFQGNDFFLYKTFAPKYEQTRRETFEQSKAYRQGMIQELQNMQFEYAKADADAKAALRKVILQRAADFPEEDMPSDLRNFIRDLKNEQLAPKVTNTNTGGKK